MRRDIIKVFLASPGDLIDERKSAKKIVDEENQNHAILQGYQFELVGWEDTVAQHGRAQAVINRDLDQCSHFIGILWKRWGSPPGSQEGTYSSGFEEEYERSEARFKLTGKPDISLLFKSISGAESNDAGPQLNRVLEFKKTFTEDYRGVYHSFDDLREFEDRFRSILALFLRNEIAESTKIETEEHSRALESGNEPEKRRVDRSNTLFEKDVRDFLSDLVSRPSDPKDYEYTAAEAAKLRLLGATLKRSENDEVVVGVHDANILYKEFRSSKASKREIRGLMAAGINYFESQNAPLWTWLSKLDNSQLTEAAFRTLVGSDMQRKNSFQVLALFPDDLSEIGGTIERDQYMDWWLSDEENDLVVAALSYLGRRGISDDLPRIDKLLDAAEATISKAAVSAKTGILVREGAELALEFISARENEDVSDLIANTIFTKREAINTDLLRKCLSNRSTRFRLRVAQELFDRNELLRVDGDVLVQSSDAQTRLLGSQAIRTGSASYSLSDARDHIVKPKKQNIFSLFPSVNRRDFEGEAAFEKFNHIVLCSRQQIELEQDLNGESLYSHDITFALYDKYFSKYRSELIKNLEDGFSSFLEEKIRKSDPSAAPDKKNGDYIRQEMIQQAVELLAVKKYRSGVQTVRNAVDKRGLKYSDSIVRYFETYGGWEDVPRVIQLSENFSSHGLTILSMVGWKDEYRLSAKAILKLGKNRVADLLSMNMPPPLWNAVIAAMSKTSFVSFDDDRITTWLRDETDSKRKTVALKSVICLPKSRIEKLLNAYISDGGQYYYNTVFWLDLGFSLDRIRSIQIAKSALGDV